jgi:hypothetical protein
MLQPVGAYAPEDTATPADRAGGRAGGWAAGRVSEAVAPETLEELYRSGIPFSEFLAQADRRKEMWTDHYEGGEVTEDLISRATAIEGTWRLLAVAEDWCSDSVNTIPYLALLTEQVDGIEMRIIDSEVGREIMEAHRTPDGRPATPTVILLNEAYEEAGCWVERPSKLQTWALGNRPNLDDREFVAQKMAWYREDGGEQTVSEILALIEAAVSGSPICGA